MWQGKEKEEEEMRGEEKYGRLELKEGKEKRDKNKIKNN